MANKIKSGLTLLSAGLAAASFTILFIPQFSLAAGAMDKAHAGTIMAQADSYYQGKEYGKAVDAYQQIIAAGYAGTSLYYNLGDAYYREGKLGLAILYYEKALRLSPGDNDVIHNLKIANARTIDKIEPLPQFFLFNWWESILALFSVTGWTCVAYLFYVLLLLCVVVYFFTKRPGVQRSAVYSGFVALLLLIASVSFLAVNLNRRLSIKSAVVITQTATVKLSPDPTSNDAFVIHEGLKVRELNSVDGWVDIQLQDGKEGWVQQIDIATI